eukprot:scaffold58821_cov63-Phaeocystis_antarctica.AAC.2
MLRCRDELQLGCWRCGELQLRCRSWGGKLQPRCRNVSPSNAGALMPTPTHPRVQSWHQGCLQLALLGAGEALPGHAQELLPLQISHASRQRWPQLLAELVGARERPLLGGQRGSQPGRGWPLGG